MGTAYSIEVTHIILHTALIFSDYIIILCIQVFSQHLVRNSAEEIYEGYLGILYSTTVFLTTIAKEREAGDELDKPA